HGPALETLAGRRGRRGQPDAGRNPPPGRRRRRRPRRHPVPLAAEMPRPGPAAPPRPGGRGASPPQAPAPATAPRPGPPALSAVRGRRAGPQRLRLARLCVLAVLGVALGTLPLGLLAAPAPRKLPLLRPTPALVLQPQVRVLHRLWHAG